MLSMVVDADRLTAGVPDVAAVLTTVAKLETTVAPAPGAAFSARTTMVATWVAAFWAARALVRASEPAAASVKAEMGSYFSRSVPVRPRLVATVAMAVAIVAVVAVPPLAWTTACTNVVKGLTMVEPSGALRSMVFKTPVSMLTPPTAMMLPLVPIGRKKLPPASVVPISSPASAWPLLLASAYTDAPRT